MEDIFDKLKMESLDDRVAALCQIVNEQKARDCTREGRELYSESQQVLNYKNFLRNNIEFELVNVLSHALTYGKSGFLLITNSTELETPLNATTEGFKRFIVVNDIKPLGDLIEDVFDPFYGFYEFYEINSSNTVHISRLFFIETEINTSLMRAFKEYLLLTEAYRSIVNKNSLIMLKVDRLNQTQNSEEFLRRYQNTLKNLALNDGRGTHALLIDKEDDVITQAARAEGASELIKSAKDFILLASNMPEIFLFGSGLGGFSSGTEYTKNYYAYIRSLQNKLLRPFYHRLDHSLFPLLFSQPLPNDYESDFLSVNVVDPQAEANIKNIESSIITNLFNTGIIDAETARLEVVETGLIKTNMHDLTDSNIPSIQEVSYAEELEGEQAN